MYCIYNLRFLCRPTALATTKNPFDGRGISDYCICCHLINGKYFFFNLTEVEYAYICRTKYGHHSQVISSFQKLTRKKHIFSPPSLSNGTHSPCDHSDHTPLHIVKELHKKNFCHVCLLYKMCEQSFHVHSYLFYFLLERKTQ